MIELLPDANVATTIATLQDLKSQLVGIQGGGRPAAEQLSSWREWAAQALVTTRSLLTTGSVLHTVLGTRFELLNTIAILDQGATLSVLIGAELEIRIEALSLAISQIEDFRRSLRRGGLAVVIDTTVLMSAGPRIVKVRWDDLLDELARTASFVIPIRVVEELDNLKDRGSSEQRNDARWALKWLEEHLHSGNRVVAFPPADQDNGKPPGDATIRVWVDDNDRNPLVDADRDIIDRALQLKPYAKKAVIVTMDTSMSFRARAYGLEAVLMKPEQIPERSPVA